MEINISGWFGFWIFMSVFCAVDTWLFSRGYDTLFYTHKTPEEKQIQQYRISILKSDAEVKQLILE
jgi:hypothetical protein